MSAIYQPRRVYLTVAIALAVLPIAAPADTIRVPGDQPTIQAGIDAAVNGDLILIADGVYTGTGNKNLDFAGKAITVRGENGRDNCIIDCEQDGRAFYFHSGEGADSVVEGLTIRNGRADRFDPVSENGAGILCVGSSPTINRCAFEACFAEERGGGIGCERGDPKILSCRFSDNDAFCGGGVALDRSDSIVSDCEFTRNSASPVGAGAGLLCFDGAPQVIDCSFVENSGIAALDVFSGSALVRGCFFGANQAWYSAAISNHGAIVTVMGCRFVSNFASKGNGAVFCSADTVLMNCEFYLNRTGTGAGGAISVRNGTVVRNCTFVGNTAGEPVGGAVRASGSASTFSNCIFWANESPWISYSGAPPLVNHSIVQGGWPGEGNIDSDPRFVDLANGDLHLLPDSPAVDAGNPDLIPSPGETDLDRQKRIWNARVDMGADEFGSFAFGDLNCNGRFDALDIEPFIVALFEPAAYPGRYPDCEILLGDINGDQSVDALDIELFIDLLFGL